MSSEPASLSILVISDIHFGKFAVNNEFGSSDTNPGSAKPMIEGLVDAVTKDGPAPTILLVAGDLTSVASPAEFNGCAKAIKSIAEKLNIPENKVFHTFGNHDVDWQICQLAAADGKRTIDPLYHDVAARQGSLFCPRMPSILSGPLPGTGIHEDDEFILFVLNSGYYCTADQAHRHGRLGSEQLKWFESEIKKMATSSKWQLVMVHHHPFNYQYPSPVPDTSCLEEGAEMLALFGKFGIDLIVHGHRHHPRVFTSMSEDWNRPMTFCCAGSLAVNAHHRDHGRIPNLFHVINLEKRLENGGAYGIVTTFEYSGGDGWRAIRDTSETPLDHKKYFGVAATTQDQEKAALEYLSTHVETLSTEKSAMLSKFGDLPPILQCCSNDRLNKLLAAEARKIECSTIGRYPESVILTKA